MAKKSHQWWHRSSPFPKTRQGSGQHTKYASISRNNAKKVIVVKDDNNIGITTAAMPKVRGKNLQNPARLKT